MLFVAETFWSSFPIPYWEMPSSPTGVRLAPMFEHLYSISYYLGKTDWTKWTPDPRDTICGFAESSDLSQDLEMQHSWALGVKSHFRVGVYMAVSLRERAKLWKEIDLWKGKQEKENTWLREGVEGGGGKKVVGRDHASFISQLQVVIPYEVWAFFQSLGSLRPSVPF